ncbi:lysophospholipid acyltransferase family protein [Pseudaeromonas sharmana]|uniref:Lysophospholipid acyltransferase family protein n=1 Tax=Pseudaeromonas sharmana TaxID=328412 RepID=A0ABV8CQZ7_9GAMM
MQSDLPRPYWLYALCRRLFVLVVAWPVVLLWLGLTVRHRMRLPRRGPAVIIANHNSHLDLLVLLTLLPLSRLPLLRPVAAADYFFSTALLRFIARWFLGLIPVQRGSARGTNSVTPAGDPLLLCREALARDEILLLFPEGTRGEPEVMSKLKPGLWHLLRDQPAVPVVPVYLQGLGKSMPKGEWIPIPFFVDAYVGRPLPYSDDKAAYLQTLANCFAILATKGATRIQRRTAE